MRAERVSKIMVQDVDATRPELLTITFKGEHDTLMQLGRAFATKIGLAVSVGVESAAKKRKAVRRG